MMKKLTFLLLCIGMMSTSWAQLSIDATNTNYTINFDISLAGVNEGPFTGSGIVAAPISGQLDSDCWATTGMSDGNTDFGASNSSGDFARGISTGGVTTGGFYAFESGTENYLLGVQQGSSDWTPGTIVLRMLNNTGTTITSLDVAYDILVFNDKGRSSSMNFAWSTDNINFTSVSTLDYVTPELEDDAPTWQTVARSATVTGISIDANAYFYIRWEGNDAGGAGSRDEYGIDNIVLSASASATATLFISEVTHPKDAASAKFVEIYNASSTAVDLSLSAWYLCRQTNGGSWGDIPLTGTIPGNGTYVIAGSQSGFTSQYGFEADQYSGVITGNGNDGYFIYRGGDHTSGTLYDAFGVINEDGSGKEWEYTNTKAVRTGATISNKTSWDASEWDIPDNAVTDDMTPSAHLENISWQGGFDSDWNTKGSNWSGANGYIPDASYLVTINNMVNDPQISAQSACYQLTINSEATLELGINPLTVYGNLEINSESARADGRIIVGSTSTQNGSLIVHGTHIGSVDVQRQFVGYDEGANNGWHNISSPVDNIPITGTEFDPTGTSDDLYQWNESSGEWLNFRNGHFTNLINGTGYLCAFELSGTKTFQGTLNTSDVDISGLTKDAGGFHLLGNPYASAIIWNNENWTYSGIGGVAQIWEEINNGFTLINSGDIIPSTNGFFVEVASAPASVTIPASARTHNASTNYKSGSKKVYDETLEFVVTNDNNNYQSFCRIGFKPDASYDWDSKYDAHKLFGGTNASEIWAVVNDDSFSQNYLPFVSDSYQLQLNFRPGVNGIHHIKIHGADSFYRNSGIFLEDIFTGTIINLSEQNGYSFTSQLEDEEERFRLHFSHITGVDEPEIKELVEIYAAGNSLVFRNRNVPQTIFQLKIFNTLGQMVHVDNVEISSSKSIRLYQKPGIYIVRLYSPTHQFVQKVIIKE